MSHVPLVKKMRRTKSPQVLNKQCTAVGAYCPHEIRLCPLEMPAQLKAFMFSKSVKSGVIPDGLISEIPADLNKSP